MPPADEALLDDPVYAALCGPHARFAEVRGRARRYAVDVAPFRIAKAPVTNEELARFVDDGGYANDAFWTDEGRRWKGRIGARAPVYWQGSRGDWRVRRYVANSPSVMVFMATRLISCQQSWMSPGRCHKQTPVQSSCSVPAP